MLSELFMRKIIRTLLIVFIIAVVASGCGKKEEVRDDLIKVGITMYDEYDPFTSTIALQIQKTIKELGAQENVNVVCDLVYAGKSQLKQNDQIDEFIRKKYDVICVNLVDRTDATSAIDNAKSANVPIFFFNREPVVDDLERWDKIYYIGADAAQSGALQAEIICDAIEDVTGFNEVDISHDEILQYVMLEGEPGHQDALMRTKVSIEDLKKAGYEVDKMRNEIANWSREQAATKMTSILNLYPWQIEVVIANDDNMALGALDALESYGVKELPLIVGVNGEKEVLEAIKDGKIEGTVYNDAFNQGITIGRMAYAVGLNREIPEDIQITNDKYVYVPYQKITKNNVDEYLEKATY